MRRRARKGQCPVSSSPGVHGRPGATDAASFPDSVKGKSNGWPGERWLDIRRLDILGPILEARMDRCRAAGLANEAHERGLTLSLKNDLGQIAALVGYFDLACR